MGNYLHHHCHNRYSHHFNLKVTPTNRNDDQKQMSNSSITEIIKHENNCVHNKQISPQINQQRTNKSCHYNVQSPACRFASSDMKRLSTTGPRTTTTIPTNKSHVFLNELKFTNDEAHKIKYKLIEYKLRDCQKIDNIDIHFIEKETSLSEKNELLKIYGELNNSYIENM